MRVCCRADVATATAADADLAATAADAATTADLAATAADAATTTDLAAAAAVTAAADLATAATADLATAAADLAATAATTADAIFKVFRKSNVCDAYIQTLAQRAIITTTNACYNTFRVRPRHVPRICDTRVLAGCRAAPPPTCAPPARGLCAARGGGAGHFSGHVNKSNVYRAIDTIRSHMSSIKGDEACRDVCRTQAPHRSPVSTRAFLARRRARRRRRVRRLRRPRAARRRRRCRSVSGRASRSNVF